VLSLFWLGLSWYALKHAAYPFLWISGYGFALGMLFSFLFRPTLRFSVNLCIVCTGFFLAECVATGFFAPAPVSAAPPAPSAKAPPTPAREQGVAQGISKDYFLDDWNYGFVPIPGSEVRYYYKSDGVMIYDKTLGIDDVGNRRMAVPPHASETVVFLGDSLTFGYGVTDDETYPAVYQGLKGGRIRALNMAFKGHGAHQALRKLQRKDDLRFVGALPVSRGFYLANPEQVNWAAGRSGWDLAGPLYELDKSGTLYLAGHFSNLIWVKLKRRFELSRALRWLFTQYDANTRVASSREYDLARYVAIVEEIAKIFSGRYHRPLTILYWGGGIEKSLPEADEVENALRARGLNVVNVRKSVPEFRREPEKCVYPVDKHFTPYGQAALARYLANAL
jgi:hypothetical protein